MAQPTPRSTSSPTRSSGPLGEEYFTRYGANGSGDPKSDYARNWRDFTFSIPEILKIYRSHYKRAPKTFLDIGAADGSLVAAALKRGLEARGFENSPYILSRIRDPQIRARVTEADAASAIRTITPGSQDIIIECAAQYLPPHRLDRYLKNVVRASSGLVCLSVDARNYQGNRSGPHAGVRTFETATWWRNKLFDAGFTVCEDDYYFFKE